MPGPLRVVFWMFFLFVFGYALVTGRIIAGSRGFKANTYSREDEPFLYYFFLIFYSLIALFVFWNS